MSVPEEAKIAQVLHDLLLAIEQNRDNPEGLLYEAKTLRLKLEDTATWAMFGYCEEERHADHH